MWDELAIIRSNTPSGHFYLHYGFNSSAAYFSPRHLQGLGLATVICSAILVTALYLKKMEVVRRHWQEDGFESSLFLAGASIYVGTFIFSSNFDYRLMFLIFCVPFLEARRFPFSSLLVVLIIVAMNTLVLDPLLGAAGLAMIWFAKIGVFVVLSAYLAVLVLAIFERRDDVSKPISSVSC
jgi:hypothetical protein